MTINIGSVQRVTVTFSTFTFFNQAVWGNISGSITDQTDLQNALNLKVNKTGDTIEGTFTNSEPVTQIILAGDNTGDGSQGQPLNNSSPRIELGTYQVSEYRSGEAQKGGYSELLRLRSLDPKAKPTIAWYSDDDKPKSWIVTHYQPQDLQIYANLASFPVTGVNDGLRAYYAQNTELYYTWNGSAYIPLLPNNSEYYYRAIHQHISFETSDTTGYSLYTRLGIPYDLDVVPITTTNGHLIVSSGNFNGKPFGAFVLQSGKTFSSQPILFYPNSDNAGTVEVWKDSASDNIFANNTVGLRLRKLDAGNVDNIVSGQEVLAFDAQGANYISFIENIIVGGSSPANLGLNRTPGATLDVQRSNLGFVNNSEYTIARLSKSDTDGFLQFGYRGNGTSFDHYLIRATNSKGLIIGTSTNPTGFTFANDGTLTLNNQQIKGIATPTATTDVANKAYVDRAGSNATAGNTVTINALRGYFTTATLTTVANSGSPTITVNSTEIASGDIVRWSFDNYSGVIGANGVPHIVGLSATAGQATATIRNIHNVNALNGTIRVFFEVLKP